MLLRRVDAGILKCVAHFGYLILRVTRSQVDRMLKNGTFTGFRRLTKFYMVILTQNKIVEK